MLVASGSYRVKYSASVGLSPHCINHILESAMSHNAWINMIEGLT